MRAKEILYRVNIILFLKHIFTVRNIDYSAWFQDAYKVPFKRMEIFSVEICKSLTDLGQVSTEKMPAVSKTLF